MCLAVPGEVIATFDKLGLPFARVRFGEVTREVCLQLQPEARPGDFVLVHVGLAIATLDRDSAARALSELEELGESLQPDRDPEIEEPATSTVRALGRASGEGSA